MKRQLLVKTDLRKTTAFRTGICESLSPDSLEQDYKDIAANT